jgi:molybdate transport repressor ModE-like protein
MNTDFLKTFVEVARQGSYARAARSLKVSQPTAFRHIRALEEILGGELVVGVGKSVVLTNQGKAALEQAVRVLEETNRLQFTTLKESHELVRANLEIAVGSTLGTCIIPVSLVELRKRYPGVRVKMSVLNDRMAIDHAVLNRGFDAGFRSGSSVLSGLDLVPLIEDELVLIAPPNHPLATMKEVTPEHLAEFEFIGHTQAAAPDLCNQIKAWALAEHIVLRGHLEFDDQEAIVSAVQAGGGISIVSAITLGRLATPANLIVLPLRPALSRHFYLVRRTRSGSLAVIDVLADIIRAEAPVAR